MNGMKNIRKNDLQPEEKDLLSILSLRGLNNREQLEWLKDILDCRV